MVSMCRYFLIWMTIVSAFGHLIIVPENTAVIEGTTVVFKCQTNNTTQNATWRASTMNTDEVKIFTRNRIAEHLSDAYKVNNSLPGQFDLHFKASLSTAKRYYCLEGSFGQSASAVLIVLASDPECNSVRKSEKDASKERVMVELRCSVTLAGNWLPNFTWTSEKSNDPITEGVTQTTQGDVITSVLSLPFQSECNSARYIFKLNFDSSLKPTETSAKNIPLYSFNWTSPVIGGIEPRDANADSNNNSHHDANAESNNNSHHVTCTVVISIVVVALLLSIVAIILLVWKLRTKDAQLRSAGIQNTTPQSEQPHRDGLTLAEYKNVPAHHSSKTSKEESEGGYEPIRRVTKTTKPQVYESLNVSK